MNWFSTGAEAADAVAASVSTKRRRNFFTKPGEGAVIRFLTPATASFNYKRSFVKWARGEKMLTSPQSIPDPFIEAGLQLQASFAWWVIDRRVLEFKDQQTGEDKQVGPRVLYFADGQRTRKQLIAFEKQMLADVNEERAEDGKDPLTIEDFNLTSYDLTVRKDPKAPWVITAKRPKKLATADEELVTKSLGVDLPELLTMELDDNGTPVYGGKFQELLAEELKPLPAAELNAMLRGTTAANGNGASEDDNSETATYAYSTSDDDTISFDD